MCANDNIPDDVGIMEFSQEDMEAIASLPLQAIKPLLSEAQFGALSKFVSVNQACTTPQPKKQ